jgi:hypothetical protein
MRALRGILAIGGKFNTVDLLLKPESIMPQTRSGSTVIEQLIHDIQFEGLNPAAV